MTDYKHVCGWRRFMAIKKRRSFIRSVVCVVGAFLLFGFVGFVEQPPVVCDRFDGPVVVALVSH